MMRRAEASPIWERAANKFTPGQRVDTKAEIGRVLKYLADNHPDLYAGWPPPAKSEQEIIQIARDLSYQTPEPVLRVRFKFLATAFDLGNLTSGWRVPLVPQLVRIKKPKNWATPERFRLRPLASKIEQAFGLDLQRPISPDPAVIFGQVLFSSVFFGCLLERQWLAPFLQAVTERQFFQYQGVLWVEMVQHHQPPLAEDAERETGLSAGFTKRFFPDNFTAALLYRILDRTLSPAPAFTQSPWELIQGYLAQLPGLVPTEQPRSLNRFLEISLSRNLMLPGSMLAYATGQLPATSLAIGPWLRCLSGKAIAIRKPPTPALPTKTSGPVVSAPKQYHPKMEEKLFAELLHQLSPKGSVLSTQKGAAILDGFFKKHQPEISSAFQLQILWARQLLRQRSSYLEQRAKKHPLKVSSVARYLRAVNTSLLIAAGNEDLLALEPQDLELIYEHAIELRPEDNMAPRCLGQFHGFLSAAYSLSPLESLELKSMGSAAGNSNANLITPEFYARVLEGLGWGKEPPARWQRLQMLAWILCYRCGLRPSEVLNLRCQDVQLMGLLGDFELLIRSGTKTRRGVRRPPASLFLAKPEQELFLSYYNQRLQETGLFGDQFLFSHPDQKSGRLLDQNLFGPIRALLLAVSQDETLRLYHSRHSFNCRLQVQLQLRGRPLLGKVNFLDLGISPEQDTAVRHALMGNEAWGRKDQYVQAILVGHATPGTTNRFYNHLSDALIGTLVKQARDRVPVSIRTIQELGGTKTSWAGELLAEQGEHSLAAFVTWKAKTWESTLRHPLLQQTLPLTLPKQPTLPRRLLPPWEEAVAGESARHLRRGEANWAMAHKVYTGILALEDKRLKSGLLQIGDIGKQLADKGRRWRGPTYASITELRSAIELLLKIAIAPQCILLVHHPRKGQAIPTQREALKMWQTRIEASVGGWHRGEPGASNTPAKGCVEVRVVNREGTAGSRKLPAMSRGFEWVMEAVRVFSPKNDQTNN